ncbi:MAG: MBL fold metallo-hydrolase [Anaerolineaceae bacterium]|nr:MBL fold metallo-hydrolase [Anaerolineaceae bacterium]
MEKEKTFIKRMHLLLAGLLLSVLMLTGCNTSFENQVLADTQITKTETVQVMITPQTDEYWDEVNLNDEIRIRQLEKGVFVITHRFPWAANSLLIEMSNGEFVWAGSTYTPEAASLILRWLEKNYGERIVTAIDTGYHVDNLGGNAALIEAGYTVYGSDLTLDLLAEKGEETRANLIDMLKTETEKVFADYHKNILYHAPTHIFPIDAGLELNFDGETVQVYYPGPSQAPDKVVVYFPTRKILFGSCMILSADHIGNAAEADIPSWINAIETLKQFDVDFVIPGHGDRLDTGLIQHTISVLQEGQ